MRNVWNLNDIDGSFLEACLFYIKNLFLQLDVELFLSILSDLRVTSLEIRIFFLNNWKNGNSVHFI